MDVRILACCLALLFSSLAVSACSAITVTWDGAAGDEDDPRPGDGIHWADGFNWDTDVIPNGGDDADVGIGHPLILETELFFISGIEVGEDGGIDIRGTLNSTGTIDNGGEIFIDNGTMPGPAGFAVGVSTLSGGGEVILGDSDFANSGARLFGPSGGGSATHAAGHTIRGEGTISGNWVNEGLIMPEDISGDMTGTLRIQGTMTNNGTLQTSATANLLFSVNITQGASGQIIADENKVIFSGVTITGGELDTLNAGVIEANFGTSRLNGVHNHGQINITGDFGSSVRIDGGGMTNDGTITIASNPAGSSSFFFGSGTNTLAGSGELVLNRVGLNARIQASDATTVGINGAGHTIRGVGAIDVTLINEGTILAEQRGDGSVLELHDSNSDSTAINNSVMRADAGATLRLSNVRITQDQVNGRIVANEGVVELRSNLLDNALVTGGRFETVGTGTIEVAISTRTDDVTNEGILNIQPGKALSIGGSHFTNNGTVNFQSVNGPFFNAATMFFIDDVTLEGDGEFVFTGTSGSAFHSIRIETGLTVTQGAEHTIRGEGLINCCGNRGTFINNGRIEGNSASDVIEINGTLGGSGLLKNVVIGETHSPGESTAIVPLEGAYTIDDFGGRLVMEIGSTTPGTGYDQLFSSDPLNVVTIGTTQTTLDLNLINGFVPSIGNTFTLLSTAGSLNGQFDTVNLPELPAGRAWEDVSSLSTIAYQVVASTLFTADFDHDGDVDSDDLDEWQGAYGTNALADADGDGDSDGWDFLEWQRQYGSGVEGLASVSVPEPVSIAMLSLVMLAVAVRFRA